MSEPIKASTREKARAATLEVREATDGDKAVRTVRVSVSSEAPVPETVFDEEAGEWVRALEILGHAEGEIDFSRCADGLVIQDTHHGDQVGLIRKVEVSDGKLGGEIEFCAGARAQEIKSDAERGLRRNMSVGYIVNRWTKVSDGDRKAGKLPTYRATSWTPYEASFVNVPADIRVGVDRNMDVTKTKTAAGTAATERSEAAMAEPKNPQAVAPAADTGAELRALTDKVNAIEARLAKPAMPAERAKPVFDENQAKTVAKRYSLARAVMGMVDRHVDNGFERECSEQIAAATKRDARGLFVPEMALRTYTGKTNVEGHITGNGAATVATELLAAQYIDALVGQTVLGQAGVQTLAGLVGDVAIPKGTAVTAGWQSSEDGAATTVTPAWSQITATTHTATGTAIVSRKLMTQSSIGVDSLISRLIVEAIGRAIETAAFEGNGTNGSPKGLANTASVGSVAMTADAPTKANLVEFWEKVLSANAGGANMKYIMSPAVKALLAKTVDLTTFDATGAKGKTSGIVGGVGGSYLVDREGKIEGYDVLMSGLCGAKKIYFGDWSQLMLAFWTGIDLIVDPYTYSANGGLQLSAFQDCDIVVRHPEAFAIGTALS